MGEQFFGNRGIEEWLKTVSLVVAYDVLKHHAYAYTISCLLSLVITYDVLNFSGFFALENCVLVGFAIL